MNIYRTSIILFLILCTSYARAQFGEPVYRQSNVQIQPEYPGGLDALYDYINNDYRWSESALKAGVSGRIVVSFIVERDGRLTNLEVVQDPGYGTGYELVRILRNSQRWRPGMYGGRDVRVYYTLPFMLPPPPASGKMVAAQKAPQYSILPQPKDNVDKVKLSHLNVEKGRYLFSAKINECAIDTFALETKRQVLSDRYSVVDEFVRNIPSDSLKLLLGRVAMQVVIDTAGKACLLSLKNELNMSDAILNLQSSLRNIKWTLLPDAIVKKKAVSVILALTFTEDDVKYQRLIAVPGSAELNEIEVASKGKFNRY